VLGSVSPRTVFLGFNCRYVVSFMLFLLFLHGAIAWEVLEGEKIS
jgi:hypothetical protein